MEDRFEPTIAALPADLAGSLEPAELYHQVLEHRWLLSEAAGTDVGLAETIESYVASVLQLVQSERHAMRAPPTQEIPVVSPVVSPHEEPDHELGH